MGLTPPHHDAVEGARLLDLDVLLAEQFEEGEEPHHHVGTACRLAAEVAEGHGPAPPEFLGQYLDHLGDADAHRGDVRRIHGRRHPGGEHPDRHLPELLQRHAFQKVGEGGPQLVGDPTSPGEVPLVRVERPAERIGGALEGGVLDQALEEPVPLFEERRRLRVRLLAG